MEFSKKLMAFASAMYAATWAVTVAAIFATGDAPWRLMESLGWAYGAALACYCGKSAYENGAKIKKGGGGRG